MTNLLITEDWRWWLTDFSRAFRLTKKLSEPCGTGLHKTNPRRSAAGPANGYILIRAAAAYPRGRPSIFREHLTTTGCG
jgi:hypothetical protein